MKCEQQHNVPDLKVFERAKILSDFGPTIEGQIPDSPERLNVGVERGEDTVQVHLTRLPCGHVAAIHPATVEGIMQTELAAALSERPALPARQRLDALYAAAQRGERVSGLEVAALHRQLELDSISDTASAEAARLERELQQQEERAAIEQPILDDLTASRDELDELQRSAYGALIDLIEAAKEHERLVRQYAKELREAGAEQPVRAVGFRQTLVVAGAEFEFWNPQTWAANVLAAVAQKHDLKTGSRWDRSELPRAVKDGPFPTE